MGFGLAFGFSSSTSIASSSEPFFLGFGFGLGAAFFGFSSSSASLSSVALDFFVDVFFADALPLPFLPVKSRSPLASEAVCPPSSSEDDSVGDPESESDAWKSSSEDTN